jgi:hypothetical protein
MKLTNQVKIQLEEFEKCYLLADADCSLGQLFDFACVFHKFISDKVQETQAKVSETIQKDPES